MRAESFIEYADSGSRTLTVDRDAGFIRGVKILGFVSKNGREYQREAVKRALGLYEGAKVNIDHGDTPRSYADRIGVLSNVQMHDDGVYGDLRYNPAHALAGQLEWDAANNPSAVGLSHHIEGAAKRANGKVVVEDIRRVVSVDLVSSPATTSSLFESNDEGSDMDIKEVTVDQLRSERAELIEGIESAAREPLAKEVEALKAQVEQLQEAEAERQRREAVRAKLVEAKWPEDKITDERVSALAKLTEDELTAVAEIVPVVVEKPTSKEQTPDGTKWESMDAKAYAEAITD